ncbi:unnamed protein product [Auanema sp. JU1783]|nr:unnamed protein product [Auanema sp. JU1783]
MRLGDLKRAVEDVILRPEQNPIHSMQKRGTIAALDLCQLDAVTSTCDDTNAPSSSDSMNACSCSSAMTHNLRQSPQLCTSTSLDTIVNRPQPLYFRHSAGVSRRQSRVLVFPSKRKRSNSLTNYNKRQGVSVSLPPSARQTPLRFGEENIYRNSLGSSESHSSVSRSEDFSQDFMAEEDETLACASLGYPTIATGIIAPATSPAPNPFMDFRNPNRDYEEMDCD